MNSNNKETIPPKEEQPPVISKAEKKQQSSPSSTKRIPYRPLRSKFFNLKHMQPRYPKVQKETSSISNFMNKLLSPFSGTKAVQEVVKDPTLHDVILKEFAKNLGHSSKLQKLRIHFGMKDTWRELTKEHFVSLAKGLKRVPCLKNFHLTADSYITTGGMKALGKGLERLNRLEKVTFEFKADSWMVGKELVSLSHILTKNALLKTVNLSWKESYMNDEEVGSLGKDMQKYGNVENFCLLLSKCEKIGDASLESLNKGLKKMKKLKSMKFSFRGCEKISDVGIGRFLDGLKHHERLENISLNFRACDKVTNAGLQGLGENLTELKSLKRLTLKFRGIEKITDEGLADFMKCVPALANLEEIKLNFGGCRKVTVKGWRDLWQVLRGVASLKRIELSLIGCQSLIENEIMKMLEDARNTGRKLTVVTQKTTTGVYKS